MRLKLRLQQVMVLVVVFSVMGCVGFMRSRPPIRISTTAKPSATFSPPVKQMRLLSRFGERGRRFHTGVDLKSRRSKAKAVLAARNGVVVFVGRLRGYGRLITLKHPDGFKSRYAHLKKTIVKKGQWVKRGQRIGVIGASGRAKGVHLHFEILAPSGSFMDPWPFIKH